EHVNRRIKRFKILQMRYRNKQRKHLLRLSLICGIYNCELQF
ncbi:MAG: IS5/IS1182 family transposase, partial [Oscillospiraceae bacterium]|nr:IS5/IS1182 family transposase [Oscillospiraceae bacterium]